MKSSTTGVNLFTVIFKTGSGDQVIEHVCALDADDALDLAVAKRTRYEFGDFDGELEFNDALVFPGHLVNLLSEAAA